MSAVIIPKIIHRIWLGSPTTPEFDAFTKSWQDCNRDWIVKVWTEQDLPSQLINQDLWDRTPDLVKSRLIWRMRSNLWRLEILLQHGGLYVDADFECLRSIDSTIAGLDCFAAEEKRGLIANGFLGASPNHPLIRRLIDDAPESVRRRPGQPSWRTTGPEHLTRTAAAMPGALSLVPTEMVYPYHHTELLADGSPPPIKGNPIAHHVWASRRKSVSVVIPWRPGCPYRERAREWIGRLFASRHPDWQIVDADCQDTMWNKAEAIIEGAKRAYGDIIVMHDADVWSDGTELAVEAVRKGVAWAMPHGLVHRLKLDVTAELLETDSPNGVGWGCEERPYTGVQGGGIVVLSRDALERVPPDTRFRGWGGEDEAWAAALNTLIGPVKRFDSPLLHLWHPPQERQSRSSGSDENTALWRAYRAARGNRQAMLEVMGATKPKRQIVTYRNTQTGRQRIVRAGTTDHQRLEQSPVYEVVTTQDV